MMRCYICDTSDNLDGAEIRIDNKTGRPMCRSCWESYYESMDEFLQPDESDGANDGREDLGED